MIIIGPFIIIVNNHYGPMPDEPPPEYQPPERRMIERPPRPPERETANMIHVTCETPGCEWDGHYETDGKAKQALGAHMSWCTKGHKVKKQPFGRTS